MAHDVFISYSSKDKPIADGICANLEASGLRCWIAPRDILPGEDWPTAITNAISRSRVMVLVFSSSSNDSEDVGREIILAANHKLVIIPFKIDNVEPVPGKQYYLARTHWLEAMNPPTRGQIQELVQVVKAVVPAINGELPLQAVSIPSGSSQKPISQGRAASPPERKKISPILVVGLILALLLVVAGIWGFPYLNTRLNPLPTQTELVKLPTSSPTATATTIVIPTSTPVPQFTLSLTLPGNGRTASHISFSPDGSLLASGSDDASVTLWDLASGEQLDVYWGHTGHITAVAFSLDGNILASASGDGTIKFWWYQLVNQQDTLRSEDTGGAFCMAFSSDGSTIASGYNRAKIILWDVSTGKELRILRDHKFFLYSVAFSPDGYQLASSGTRESSILLNETASGELLRTLNSNHGDVEKVVFLPDGSSLLGLTGDNTVTLWDTGTWEEERSYTAGDFLTLSPDGNLLATSSGGKGSVTLMDSADGTWLQTLPGGVAGVASLAFSSDGQKLAAGFADGTIMIWQLDE